MSNFKRQMPPGPTVPGGGLGILSKLQATSMIDSRASLPAEIIASILDYLPIPDLLRFARTSRRMCEMVYDDTRWVARLKSMGLWNEAEARQRLEDAMRRRREAAERAQAAAAAAAAAVGTNSAQGHVAGRQASTTLFDASVEEERQKKLAESTAKLADGFETMNMASSPSRTSFNDPSEILDVLKRVKSVRGHAREEFGKVYGALAPFYFDLARAKSHTEPIVFKAFRDPEGQARMLSNLNTFRHSDWSSGWLEREERLRNMIVLFESAVLREFEQGYEFWDVDGRMKRYAHVLHSLNGGNAAMELFIAKHPTFDERESFGNPIDCINGASSRDDVTLEPSRIFFERLSKKVNEQSDIITRIFPGAPAVFWEYVDKVREDVVMDYTNAVLDETHDRSLQAYLKAASGLFEQCMAFVRSLQPPKGSPGTIEDHAKEVSLRVFEPHLDLYLQEELDSFTKHVEREVTNWDQKLSEQDASTESFYMANFTRRADKNDFLSSFKKVVMMPVTVLPSIPLSSPFGGGTKQANAAAANGSALKTSTLATPSQSRPDSPGPGGRTGTPLPAEAPTDELKAKAALMASRLEGIKSLFSIEVALSLVHTAKSSLGRAAKFTKLGGQAGEEAREQCEAIFVVLLRVLGQTHVKNGFTKAVDHLSRYNPREISNHDQAGVAPLVTFIELVNVGDLISQMIDVFYEQQLAAPKIADRNDFLDPAGLAKKKFEQMLDENVAAGLNKGIDVLMDEVEYLCATTQLPTDYNPPTVQENGKARVDFDIGPTTTAKRVVELVSSHTNMLIGSTEKTMLDVFNGEVGLRLFTALCKHLKRQRISTDGAIKLIADVNLYFEYIRTLKNKDLLEYFKALRELSQIYLIDPRHSKEMAKIIADGDKFGGIFRPEEAYEFAERRADWFQVKKHVEKAMYGLECLVM
ncbi:exocyst complex component Sec10-domain-containing protein [Microdochium trichocladiopsis]|uniref:Exocyst complex component Sec10-domain-containing protein n=1 Tax=Microdochium trichocladiopsis TaxID=1682393 RepID=A0A9P9BPM6_9PEZI|nr:exocyst complex component Sec10-domain-containing protein [Microdochium trichocladiopsis]KAH7033294.1 exocyst complex component Sec10-domain-containing protein [Microdochium trichocladiopsis]